MGISVKPSAFIRLPAVPRPQLLGRGVLSVGPNAPVPPMVGDLWWRTEPDGALYLYYDDGSSAQWVTASPGVGLVPGVQPPWIQFPDSPLTVGQQFTATNGVQYTWDGTVWVGTPVLPTTTLPGPFTVTGPIIIDGAGTTAPVAGEIIWNGTNFEGFDGTTWRTLDVPWGPAGGDLAGSSYPAPIIAPLVVTNGKLAAGAVSDAKVSDVGWAKITGAPPIAPLPISRANLAPNAPCGTPVFAAIPTSTPYNGPLAYTTVASVSLTTRGGSVFLLASSSLAAVATPAAGANASLRWFADGSRQVTSVSYLVNTDTHHVPLATLTWVDAAPAAGAHTYAFQLALESGITALSSNLSGGSIMAIEVG